MLRNIKKLYLFMMVKNKKLFLTNIIYTFFSLVSPFLLAYGPSYIINMVVNNKSDFKKIIFVILIYFIISSLVFGIVNFINSTVWIEFGLLRFKLMAKFYNACMIIPYSLTEDPKYLDKIELAKTYVNDVDGGVQEIFKNYFYMPAIIFSIMVYFAIFSKVNFLLILMIIIYLLVSNYLIRKSQMEWERKSEENSKYLRELENYNSCITDYKKVKELKLYFGQKLILDKLKKLLEKKKQLKLYLEKKNFVSNIATGVGEYLTNGIMYSYFGYLFFSKKINIGEFYAYIILSTGFKNSLNQIVEKFMFLKKTEFYTNIFFEIINFKTKNKLENKLEEKYRDINFPIEVEFRNVSFRYSENHPFILKNCSFKINDKERVALIGENGAGKSTLIKLLLRLYEPTEGEIYINNISIKNFDDENYRKIFSVVFQDIYIYAASFLENILTNPINEKDMEKFGDLKNNELKNEDIINFFENKPEKYNSELTKYIFDNGMDVSGGQQQQIAMLRAIFQGHRFFIFDEPTAALDPLAEEKLYEKFDELTKNKSVIFISHRMAACKLVDKIFFIGNGKIEESGSHSELILKNGKYAEFYNNQASMYNNKTNGEVKENEL
ncbi:MAG: ABC transporter ATP-binding protein [Fusobacteriaceae bacterium]